VLAGEPGAGLDADGFCADAFPSSIAALRTWRSRCDARIGFLDPDSYAHAKQAEPGQVDRDGHAAWLEALHQDAGRAASVMFFATRNHPDRPDMIAAFHGDQVALFPRSVVFCHEKFVVGVRLRGDDDDAFAVVRAVERAWGEWGSFVGRKAPLTSIQLTKHS